jgi:hypothetical protein
MTAICTRGTLTDVARTTTYVVEITVGIACLAAAWGAFRRSRWLTVALVVAGLAATVHGTVALTT